MVNSGLLLMNARLFLVQTNFLSLMDFNLTKRDLDGHSCPFWLHFLLLILPIYSTNLRNVIHPLIYHIPLMPIAIPFCHHSYWLTWNKQSPNLHRPRTYPPINQHSHRNQTPTSFVDLYTESILVVILHVGVPSRVTQLFNNELAFTSHYSPLLAIELAKISHYQHLSAISSNC